jgi:hypothetical protein
MPGIKKTKAQLADEINNSPYFTLKKEKEKLLTALYLYECSQYHYQDDNAEYVKAGWRDKFNEILFGCFNQCIKPDNFDPQKGIPFLHYFNRIFKRKLRKADINIKIDEASGGMAQLPNNKLRSDIKKLMAIVQERGEDPQSEKSITFYAHSKGLDPQKVRKIIVGITQQKVRGEYFQGKDSEVSVFDTDSFNLSAREDILLEKVETKGKLEKIEKAVHSFVKSREQLLINVITLMGADKWINLKEKYSFINYDLLEQYKERFIEEAPSQREIAALLGKNESAISRAIHEFQDKMKTL